MRRPASSTTAAVRLPAYEPSGERERTIHKTLKKAAVVGASILAFSGVAAGVAQATPRQGADIY